MVWNMLTMDAIYIYDSIVPTFPVTATLAIEDGTKGKARKSWRYLSRLLAGKGYEVSSDLPGGG
jgi:hypothetical protein